MILTFLIHSKTLSKVCSMSPILVKLLNCLNIYQFIVGDEIEMSKSL